MVQPGKEPLSGGTGAGPSRYRVGQFGTEYERREAEYWTQEVYRKTGEYEDLLSSIMQVLAMEKDEIISTL